MPVQTRLRSYSESDLAIQISSYDTVAAPDPSTTSEKEAVSLSSSSVSLTDIDIDAPSSVQPRESLSPSFVGTREKRERARSDMADYRSFFPPTAAVAPSTIATVGANHRSHASFLASFPIPATDATSATEGALGEGVIAAGSKAIL